MKKAISAVSTVIVMSGLAAGLLVWKKAEAPKAPVAQWLPSGTVLLVELPDLAWSETRWPQTALHALAQEPEIAAFLERPRSKLPQGKIWADPLEHLRQADLQQGFFSVARIADNMPHMRGGIRFRGTRREAMEAMVAKVRTQAQAASPAGKSDLLRHGSFEIETFSDKGVTVTGAFANDWYFFGNDVGLLKSVLDRFAAPKSPGSLVDDALYTRALVHLPADADFRYYASASDIIEKLTALTAASGRSLDAAQTTRMEGERMHDTFFVLQPGYARLPELSRKTLALTSPGTLLYYATVPTLPDRVDLPPGGLGGMPGAAGGLLGGLQGVLTMLGEQGVRIADFKNAFGPEFAGVLNWPAPSSDSLDNVSSPSLQISAEVRNPAAARKFTDALCAGWPRENAPGLTLFRFPATDGTPPVLGLTDRFLLASLGADPVKSAAAKARAGGPTLEQSAGFKAALASVVRPGTTLLYIDTKPLFERVYEWLRPMAMIWANFVPHAGDYVQMARLPSTEVIARHLQPMVVSSSQQPEGTLVESAGTVTFFQAATAVAAITGAAAVPVIQGKINVPRVDNLIDTFLLGNGPAPAKPDKAPPVPTPPAAKPPTPQG